MGEYQPGYMDAVLLLKDGTPLITRYFSGQDAPSYRDLEGKTVPPPLDAAYLTPSSLGRTWGPMGMVESPRLTDGQTPAGYWYFLEDHASREHRGYFVGYDSHTNRIIGYLGLHGFQENHPEPDQMFPGISRGDDSVGRGTEKGLYYLADNSVHQPLGPRQEACPPSSCPRVMEKCTWPIFSSRLSSRCMQAIRLDRPPCSISPCKRSVGHCLCIALRTEASIITLDMIDGHFLKEFEIPNEFRDSDFQFAMTSGMEMILEKAGPSDSMSFTNDLRFVHVPRRWHQGGPHR